MNDTEPQKTAGFDQVMLAMDVVDTLRHQESLVERELSAEADDRALVEKVRGMYAAQGIEVSEATITEAVAALREGRFTYRPPQSSWKLTLARIYANRGWWLKVFSFLAAFIILGVIGHRLFFVIPETKRIEDIATLRQTLLTEAREPQVRARVEALYTDAQNAAKRGDTSAAKNASAELGQIADQVLQAYEIRIVSKGDLPSGVWRIPDVNANAKNYYIIVEAIGLDGKQLKLPITSEEDNRTQVVDMWGVRVDPAVFEKIRRDKTDVHMLNCHDVFSGRLQNGHLLLF